MSEGSLDDPQPLGLEADEPGSMWIEQGRLLVRQRTPRRYDALDLSVRAIGDAKLMVQLSALGDHPAEKWIEAPLKEVLSGGFTANLDDRGSRIRIARRPGDRLPVSIDARSMVFAPGDKLRFALDTTRLGVGATEKVRFLAELKDPRIEKAVWQTEVEPIWKAEQTASPGDSPSLQWEVPLDVDEGVYQLTIAASQSGWLSLPHSVDSSIVGGRNRAQRMIELVVLDPRRPRVPTGELGDLHSAKVVEEIDPSRPDWWKRFANLRQLPRLKRLWNGPLGNQRSEIVDHSLGPVVRLQPNAGRKDLSWEAYTIPIKAPGTPHILEVLYPSDAPQTLGVSIVEANEFDEAVQANLDTGVDQFEEVVASDEPAQWRRHRVVFWPRTKTPIVRITNHRDADPAVYGRIRVLRIDGHLPRAYAGGPTPPRMFAAYLDRPLFPESFSAEKIFVPPSQLGMDDWKTFYQGGTRLAEYLNHVGYGGLFLSVYADGSTIYPSELLEPTTRYDTGALLGTGQDPMRKDVLEMLFRIFDREGLKLIPALEFATPLPQLEAKLRHSPEQAQGMVWIGRDGRSWPQVHRSSGGRAPYYNVLHPEVQEAMLDVVRELVERYADHPSFAGVTIQLAADGYGQLPDRSWGLDDATVKRFEEATDLDLATGGPERFGKRFWQVTSTQIESKWLKWRAEQLARFYGRVQQELTARRPDTRLYLAGARMLDGEVMQDQLRPALPQRLTLDKTMLRVGIDPRLYSTPESPVLLFGETILPWTSLADQSVSLELESMRTAEDLAGDFGATAALFYLQPREMTLPSFDRMCPFQPSVTRLTTQAVPSAAQNRRRFVRTLAHFDPLIAVDGSLRISLGQEESLRDLIALYRRLPAARFQRLEGVAAGQPITVRHLRGTDATYFVVINEAGFPIEASIRLEMPPGCGLEELTGLRRVAPLRTADGGTYWDVQLDSYDAVGVRLLSPEARIVGARARWSEAIDQALTQRVSELENRRKSLVLQPRQWVELANADFEAEVLEDRRIPGWMFPPDSGASVQVDTTVSHTGGSSLRLTCDSKAAIVMSHPFRAPKTGRLTVSMWVKSGNPEQKVPPMRIGVYGIHRGRTYYPDGMVKDPIGDRWCPVVFRIDDVPQEGLDQLQLRIELTQPGQVWLDDVRLQDLAFDLQEERALLKTVYHPAKATLEDGQVIQCIRILEGYWPRFLLKHVPPMESPVVARTPDRPEPAARTKVDEEAESDGFFKRIRNLVPGKLF